MKKRIEQLAGNHINQACAEAVELAKREGCEVEFDFNDQTLIATSETDPQELARSYSAECDRRHKADIESPEYKRRQEEAEREQKAKEATLNALLADAPKGMTLRDPEAWKKSCEANTDPYGGGVMTYAELWARLMEAKMNKGEALAEIAGGCSHLADIDGITGFMYGCAVSVLAKVWVHGEELRRWHNKDTQIGTEGDKANESGGVLNPALLVMDSKA